MQLNKQISPILALFSLIILFGIHSCKKLLDPNDPGNLVLKTVDQDPSLPAIFVNNAHFHSEAFGNPDSSMVVLLHGGPGGDYRYLLKAKQLVNDGYYVVFFDQRGAGLSERFDASIFSIQIVLDDLNAIIDYYRTSSQQKVFLIGHSWGAMYATAFVNTYPNVIDGIVLAEPGGFTSKQTLDYIKRAQNGELFDENTSDTFFYEQLLTGDENDHQILDYRFMLRSNFDNNTEENIIGNPPGAIEPEWRNGAVTNIVFQKISANEGFDWTTNLGQFNKPVLFIYSENNKAYGTAHATLLSSSYPDIQLVQMPDCGHDMIYFQWEEFYPLALNYLNSLN